MSFYSVLAVTPTNEDWIPDYLATAGAVLAKHGGKYLARTASHERLEGEGDEVALRIILEWPSKEAAINFMDDAEYVPLLKARTAGSISHHILIEGKDDLA
ncbi:MAG: DUF1330 domain-containing protein [Motiliproteus sp.]|nr:DUF1330 domain-containing protein [Motiliproteus sp.]